MRFSLGARRFRLIDGVILGAAGLLALKGIALFAVADGPEPGPGGLPPFMRVVAHARQGYVPSDPDTTGSVPDAHAGPAKEEPGAAPPPGPAAPPAPDAATPAASAGSSPAERAINERLRERRAELDQHARDIEARQGVIDETERRLDARVGEIQTQEDRQAGARQGGADAEAAALKPLVTMYETMKPKEAARVFERLPHDVLVPVVRGINPRKMAEILAAMSPESAEKLTVALARRGRPAGEDRSAAAAGLPPGELPAIEPARRPPPPRS